MQVFPRFHAHFFCKEQTSTLQPPHPPAGVNRPTQSEIFWYCTNTRWEVERGEANAILLCKLRSAHHFSQRLIKMFRTPWRNVAKCGYGRLSAVVKHKKYMNPLRTS